MPYPQKYNYLSYITTKQFLKKKYNYLSYTPDESQEKKVHVT
jgi:hypothetical protein